LSLVGGGARDVSVASGTMANQKHKARTKTAKLKKDYKKHREFVSLKREEKCSKEAKGAVKRQRVQ